MLEIQPHPIHSALSPNYTQESNKCKHPIHLIDRIKTSDIEIDCCVESVTNRKVLTLSGEHHYSFRNFLSDVPKNIDISALAKALNYLINGIEGSVITDPDLYRKEHSRLQELDTTIDPRLIDFNKIPAFCQGEYDISIIESPKFLEATFEFYVEIYCTPYRVICIWPVDTDPPLVKKEILPHSEKPIF